MNMIPKEITYLVAVFPAVFMIHDFEEIIFFKVWLIKNKQLLIARFPRLSSRMLPHLDKLSTAGFSVAVAEEFVLLSIITIASFWWQNYILWLCVFMAFSIHLLVHFLQWLIWRSYLPSIATTLLFLPYCVFTLYQLLLHQVFTLQQVFNSTLAGILLLVLNLMLAHKLALAFEKWRSTNDL